MDTEILFTILEKHNPENIAELRIAIQHTIGILIDIGKSDEGLRNVLRMYENTFTSNLK